MEIVGHEAGAILGTAVGVMALGVQVGVLARPRSSGFIALLSLAVGLWSAHYFLIGAAVAGALHAVGLATNLLACAVEYESAPLRRTALGGAIGSSLVAAWTFYVGPTDLIPLLGSVVMLAALFMLREAALRCAILAAQIVFFAYGAYLGSFPLLVATALTAGAAILGLARLRVAACPAAR